MISKNNIRSETVEHIKKILYGPIDGPEEKVITKRFDRQYMTGILYAKNSSRRKLSEKSSDLNTESSIDFEKNTEEFNGNDGPLELAYSELPSSVGLSFIVSKGAKIKITCSAATYEMRASKEDKNIDEEKSIKPEKKENKFIWHRRPIDPDILEIEIEKNENISVLQDKGLLDIICRKRSNGILLTVSLLNNQDAKESFDAKLNLYQTTLSCELVSGSLEEYDKIDPKLLTISEKIHEIQFMDKPTYAIAHGASCAWDKDKNKVWSEYIPEEHVYRPVYDDLIIDEKNFKDVKVFNISYLSDPKNYPENVPTLLYSLCDFYEQWIMSLNNISSFEGFEEAEKEIISRAKTALNRMRKSIDLIKNDQSVQDSFRLANLAMLDQMALSSNIESLRKNRTKDQSIDIKDQWPIPVESDIEIEKVESHVMESYNWRPFQLAFSLIVIESLQDNIESLQDNNDAESIDYKEIVDLIWFTTGGGKTEAYLLLAVYELLRRRIQWGDKGAGTSVITRYTYRFLTADQFIRSARLICCLERIRRVNEKKLGKEIFSIGLYVGSGLTPNVIGGEYGAHEKLKIIKTKDKPNQSNDFQISECPVCATRLLPDNNKEDEYGFKIDEINMTVLCPSKKCDFHSGLGLPIMVVDEAIYNKPPSFLIGTIDKFANLCANEAAKNIFGIKYNQYPPSLIIQDELHLISGSLGTIASLYEAGMDQLIKELFVINGKKNRSIKYIASTATVRDVETQTKRLMARDVAVFPPRGLRSSDSFFAREDESKDKARLYIGVMPQGISAIQGSYWTSAAILEAVDYIRNTKLDCSKEAIDFLWTLLCYCNSKRELGLINKAAGSEIQERMLVYRQQLPEHYSEPQRKIAESRLEISADAITNVMDARDKLSRDGFYSFVPCTNMVSVGIDINRLGLMMVNGQPKLTSEYIQATSRVGRRPEDIGPGLIITYYSPTKPRDRSHYELFKQYHTSMYRMIEPTSVTPGSEAALERALHASLVMYLRFISIKLQKNTDARNFNKNKYKKFIDSYKKRILSTYPNNKEYDYERKQIDEIFTKRIDEWDKWAKNSRKALNYKFKGKSDTKSALLEISNIREDIGWDTMTSMRNVDGLIGLKLDSNENG